MAYFSKLSCSSKRSHAPLAMSSAGRNKQEKMANRTLATAHRQLHKAADCITIFHAIQSTGMSGDLKWFRLMAVASKSHKRSCETLGKTDSDCLPEHGILAPHINKSTAPCAEAITQLDVHKIVANTSIKFSKDLPGDGVNPNNLP